MKLDYHLLSVVALLCICHFGFSDTQQIVGSENAANVGRDLDLYFLDDEDSREPFNAHHVSKREAVPSRKAPKKKKESSPAESLMGSGDSEDSDDTEDSSRVFTPPSDDEDGEDIDGSGDIFSVKPKTTKKARVSTPPPIRGENSRPSSSTPSSSTTSSTTSTAMPTTTSTTTEEPATSTAVPTTMRTPSTKRPSLSTTSMPEDDEDSEDDGDYEGSGAGEAAIVGGHINVPRKPDGANKHTTKKPNSGDTSILSPSDYGDIVEEDPVSTEDGDIDDEDDDDDDDNIDIEGSPSTPKSSAPTSTIEPSSTTSTTTPPPTTTISSTTTEISTSTAATDIPKSTTTAFAPGADEEGEDEEDDDEDDTDDLESNTPPKIKPGLNNNNGVDNTGDDYSNNNNNNNNNNANNNNNSKQSTKTEDNSEENDIGHDKDEDNLIPGGTSREVHLSRHRATQRPSTLLGQPGILVAIMGGAVVGLLLAILCVMFVVYRMRKKDEGSFPLGKRTPDDHFSTHRRHYMRPSANREFYA